MARIPLGNGREALIDDADRGRLTTYSWFARPAAQRAVKFYAVRSRRSGEVGPRTVYLHRFILEAPRGVFVDHINGDTLDNRRANLRLCTAQENSINRVYTSESGFRGVQRVGSATAWRCGIEVNGVPIRANGFRTPEMAARAYDALAREFQGEFAVLNFPAVVR